LVRIPGTAFSRKEGSIMRQVRDELLIVRETEQEIPGLLAAIAEADFEAALLRRNRIFQLETRASKARREVSEKIAEGAFFGGVREDIINLLEKIEKIADKAKDAARLITLVQITDAKAREIMRSEAMKQFLNSLDLAVEALQGVVEAFEIDRKDVLEGVKAVQENEEQADGFKQEVLAALFDRTRAIDPVTLILVRDFVFCADDVADNAEHASDIALVLVAKGYG
jgi:predicted phosphate transport protein (TIGR00153 family)